jgi:hypothetical protein
MTRRKKYLKPKRVVEHKIIDGIEMKKCSKCGKDKPILEFAKDSSSSDALRSACKVCCNEQTRISRKNKPKIIKELPDVENYPHKCINGVKVKQCCKCSKEKNVEDYHKDKTKKDGLASYCKTCSSEYKKARKTFLETHRIENPIVENSDTIEFKKCSKCYEEKPLSDFGADKSAVSGLRVSCKACNNERRKLYVKNNPEKIAAGKIAREEYHRKYSQTYKRKRSKNKDAFLPEDKYIKSLLSSLRQSDIAKNRSFDLDFDYIKDLILIQENRCRYTGNELVWKRKGGMYQGTIDRIDSTKGHIKGNVELVILCVNFLRSNLDATQFKYLLHNIYSPSLSSDMEVVISSDKIIHIYDKQVRKNRVVYHTDIDYTRLDLVEFIKTHSCCALTGVKVDWRHHKILRGSIDRIDSSKPYSRDNIQVVLYFINTMKKAFDNDDILLLLENLRNIRAEPEESFLIYHDEILSDTFLFGDRVMFKHHWCDSF